MEKQPDPRFSVFEQQFNSNGKAIGFLLPNNDFVFKYDKDGGWEDQTGNYYNSEGILVDGPQSEGEDVNSEEGSQLSEEDQLVDKFQELLMEEEEGIIPKKQKKNYKVHPSQQNDEFDFLKDFEFFLENLTKKTQSIEETIRKGLPAELFIYFKIRSKFYERITPLVQYKQSVEQKREYIKAQSILNEETRKKLMKDNPWLNSKQAFLDFSGTSLGDNIYDRYWYGHVKVTAENYIETYKHILKSKEFAPLEDKSYYSLKSKFYMKSKIKTAIQELETSLGDLKPDEIVKVTLNNLPIDFPLSFVYDLIDLSGGKANDVQDAIIKDEQSAEIWCLPETAFKLCNIEGYCHEKGKYIWLQVKKQGVRRNQNFQFYQVAVDTPFNKIHERELCDTLLFQLNRSDLAKHYSKEQEQKQKYRFVIGSIECLRRLLMYRGNTINIVKVAVK